MANLKGSYNTAYVTSPDEVIDSSARNNSSITPVSLTSYRTSDAVLATKSNSKLPAIGAEKSVDNTENGNDEQDPWNIVPGIDEGPNWTELSTKQKLTRVLWILARLLMIVGLLYCFVCSLDVLQDAFQLLGGRTAGSIFASSVLVSNPVAGLMIGVLVTVLVQSSSTSTSIVVSMVASGLLEVKPAIPIIMGSNIGTTVTNTLVALTQSSDRAVFRRAFAGATVHDAFNWLTVSILLPLEAATGYLYHLTGVLVSGLSHSEDSENPEFLKVITQPFTKLIAQIDKTVITAIAQDTDRQKFPLAKYWCKQVTKDFNLSIASDNETLLEEKKAEMFAYNVKLVNDSQGRSVLRWTEVLVANSTKCSHLFVGVGLPGYLSEAASGIILLIASLLALVLCLLFMVKVLNSLLSGSMASLVRKSINANFPGKWAFLTGYVAIMVGAGVTVLVQSSSVFTSALTPLVGLGVVTVERVYPLTLGSNIGTTITSILAALTADADMIQYTMQIALCHLFFNISGIAMFYPIPHLRRIPIGMAKALGNITAKYRWFAVVYLIVLFLVLPLLVFGLSMAGLWVLIGVGIPVLVLIISIVIIKVLQKKQPHWLPRYLRTWKFLPKPLRSLEPYDRLVSSCCCCYEDSYCRRRCCKSGNIISKDDRRETSTSELASWANNINHRERRKDGQIIGQERRSAATIDLSNPSMTSLPDYGPVSCDRISSTSRSGRSPGTTNSTKMELPISHNLTNVTYVTSV